MVRAAIFLLALAVWLYGIVDCARTDGAEMPGRLGKTAWLLLVIFLPVVGTIIWITVMWPYRHPQRTITFGGRSPQQPVAPDDDTDFLDRLDNQLKFQEWEREQRNDDGDVK